MKKRLLYILILPFCLLVINSCKKNPLPPEQTSGEPVFYFKCDELGRFDAGVSDYYMNSSHEWNDSVYTYKAELKQNSCNTCSYGISILINDSKVSAPEAAMQPEKGLTVGNYEFNDGNLPPWGYDAAFVSTSSTYSVFTWSYSDGSSLSGPIASDNHFFKAGAASVTLNVVKGADQDTHFNVFDIGNSLQSNITVMPLGGNSFRFYALPTLTAGSQYAWEFGDGFSGAGIMVQHEYAFTPDPYRTATLTVTNNTNTCVSYYHVPVLSPSLPVANFTSSFTPVPNTKKLSAITIILTAPDGKVYSSASLDQGSNNKIEIVSVEDYKPNDAKHATKKLKIKFNCMLKNGSEQISLTGGEAVIAVSYR